MTNEPKIQPSSAGFSLLAKALIIVVLIGAVGIVVYLKNNDSQTQPVGSSTEITAPPVDQPSLEPVPTGPLPRLMDLGSKKCIPCKMMEPILEQLREEYAGRMEVIFIDVMEDPESGENFRVQLIPTQIFFDASGKELDRHVGFYSKEEILNRWKELGVQFAGTRSAAQAQVPSATAGAE